MNFQIFNRQKYFQKKFHLSIFTMSQHYISTHNTHWWYLLIHFMFLSICRIQKSLSMTKPTLTKFCGRYHAFSACRSQNYDKITIFDFIPRRREKMGIFVFFLKYKIGYNVFITILGSANLNFMMFTTKYCLKPTDNVHGGSIGHTV